MSIVLEEDLGFPHKWSTQYLIILNLTVWFWIFMYHKTPSMVLGWKSVRCGVLYFQFLPDMRDMKGFLAPEWFVTGIFAGSSSAFRSTGTWSSSWTREGPEGREGEGGTTLRWTWKTCVWFVAAMCEGKIATQAWELSLTFTSALRGISTLFCDLELCQLFYSAICALQMLKYLVRLVREWRTSVPVPVFGSWDEIAFNLVPKLAVFPSHFAGLLIYQYHRTHLMTEVLWPCRFRKAQVQVFAGSLVSVSC